MLKPGVTFSREVKGCGRKARRSRSVSDDRKLMDTVIARRWKPVQDRPAGTECSPPRVKYHLHGCSYRRRVVLFPGHIQGLPLFFHVGRSPQNPQLFAVPFFYVFLSPVFFCAQAEDLRGQLQRATTLVSETKAEKERLQGELVLAMRAVEDRSTLQQRYRMTPSHYLRS